MNIARLFNFKLRGFRVVDLTAFAVLGTLVLGVYGFKALAGRESAQIGDMDKQIAEEQHRVRLLKAELAHLEQPERIGRLSTDYLGLAPLSAKREAPADALTEIARHPGDPAPTLVTAAPPVPSQTEPVPTVVAENEETPTGDKPAAKPVRVEAGAAKPTPAKTPAKPTPSNPVVAQAEPSESRTADAKPAKPATPRKVAAASQVPAESVAR